MDNKLSYKIIQFKQGTYNIILFSAPVNDIYEHFSINRRVEDKDEGYQRALSQDRVEKISKYVTTNNVLPLSILVSLDKNKYKINNNEIIFNDEKDIGWVIDGQHRMVGAYKSKTNIIIPVVSFFRIRHRTADKSICYN